METNLELVEKDVKQLLIVLDNYFTKVRSYGAIDVQTIVYVDPLEALYFVEKMIRRKTIVFWAIKNNNISIFIPKIKTLVVVEIEGAIKNEQGLK